MYTTEYGYVTKATHRGGIAAQYYLSNAPRSPMLYLDGCESEATRTFAETWHIPPQHLFPVNRNDKVVQHIRSVWPEVRAVQADIDTFISEQDDDSFSVVWLDYMCKFSREHHVPIMKHALRVGRFVTMTFSLRGVNYEFAAKSVLDAAKRVGSVLERPSFYKGKSDVENMMRVMITRHPQRKGESGKDSSTFFCGSSEEEGNHGDEVDDTPPYCLGDKVFVPYGDTFLTALVEKCDADNGILVRFDYDAKCKWVCPSVLQYNDSVVDDANVVGNEIGVPIRVFNGDFHGYDDVKQNNKLVFFKVGKRYRRGNRFAIHGVRKHGGIIRVPEKWTVTAEQALCWTVQSKKRMTTGGILKKSSRA